jgi:alkylation response protein AidB-like acyl-CoA dehydrogenase
MPLRCGRQFAELGAIGALFPEAEGGFGGAGFDVAVVFEALGRGLVVEPFLGALVVGRALAAAGTPAQKEQHCQPSSTAAPWPPWRTTSPAATTKWPASDPCAVRSGDGWVLNGAKAVVVQGDGAQLLLVSARTVGRCGQ